MDLIANLPSAVNIIEVCRVTPSSPQQQLLAPNSLPLTFFDLLWLRFHPIQRLFFYQLPSTISFLDAILPNLKTSLSLALRHYLPLAGNLLWPPHSPVPTVEFVEGDGVLLTVAESDADFHHLSGYGFRGVTEYHPLVPQLPVSHDRAAVIALQVTLFPDRGFSIGMTNHHAILDGRTATSFVKLWARICNLYVAGGLYDPTTEPMPFYNRIEDPRGIAEIYANVWLNMEGPNNRSLNLHLPNTPPGLIRYTLELTRQNLQNLKQCVLNKRDDNKKNKNQPNSSHISSFALATAYVCVCTARSEGLTEGKLVFAFVADARFRVKPPMPSNYFGNCLSGGAIFVERSELLGENGMVVASEAISEAIKSLEEGALNGVENWCSIMATATIGGDDHFGAKAISVAGSPRFDVYSADFGWGRPMKVELVSAESSETISLSESRNGDGGMEIGVVKNKEEIESFVALFSKGLECL